jgi:hypothetical protein
MIAPSSATERPTACAEDAADRGPVGTVRRAGRGRRARPGPARGPPAHPDCKSPRPGDCRSPWWLLTSGTRSLLPGSEALMTSAPVRDPIADHLLTPENLALLLIDYQPGQLTGVRSMDRALLVKNAVSTVRIIKTFDVPVVHSTVNVASGADPGCDRPGAGHGDHEPDGDEHRAVASVCGRPRGAAVCGHGGLLRSGRRHRAWRRSCGHAC